jgi:hypothetical protein
VIKKARHATARYFTCSSFLIFPRPLGGTCQVFVLQAVNGYDLGHFAFIVDGVHRE